MLNFYIYGIGTFQIIVDFSFIINILYCRVIIKRATTESLLSGQFGTHHGAKSGTEVPMEDKKTQADFKETFIFKWQEKIFNRVQLI